MSRREEYVKEHWGKTMDKIQSLSHQYANENLKNPTVTDYLFVHNVLLKGFELGIAFEKEIPEETGA